MPSAGGGYRAPLPSAGAAVVRAFSQPATNRFTLQHQLTFKQGNVALVRDLDDFHPRMMSGHGFDRLNHDRMSEFAPRMTSIGTRRSESNSFHMAGNGFYGIDTRKRERHPGRRMSASVRRPPFRQARWAAASHCIAVTLGN